MDLAPYLSVLEAARLLSVSPQWLRQCIRAGKLRALRVGRAWVVSRVSVEAALLNR